MQKNETVTSQMLLFRLLHKGQCFYVLIISSVLIGSPSAMAVMHPQAMTKPLPCVTDGCRQLLLYLSPDLFCAYSWQFEQKCSHLDSSLHQVCCHWFSVHFLHNLLYLRLFASLTFLKNNFLPDTPAVKRLWWIIDGSSCISKVPCQVFAGFSFSCFTRWLRCCTSFIFPPLVLFPQKTHCGHAEISQDVLIDL